MLDARTIFSPDSILKKSEYRETYTQMESKKLSYADVLKNSSSYLNSSLPVRLLPKAPRTRLTEGALTKLRSVIHEKPNSAEIKREKLTKLVKEPQEVAEGSATNPSQPLILAMASDWFVSGSVMSSAIYDNKSGV